MPRACPGGSPRIDSGAGRRSGAQGPCASSQGQGVPTAPRAVLSSPRWAGRPSNGLTGQRRGFFATVLKTRAEWPHFLPHLQKSSNPSYLSPSRAKARSRIDSGTSSRPCPDWTPVFEPAPSRSLIAPGLPSLEQARRQPPDSRQTSGSRNLERISRFRCLTRRAAMDIFGLLLHSSHKYV